MREYCRVYLTNEEGSRFFGPGPAELLDRVALCGSLSHAAEEMHLSYSKAMRMVRTAEREFGFALLESASGGSSGGGSTLTPQAREVLRRFRACELAAQNASRDAFSLHFPAASPPCSGRLRGTDEK